MVLGCLSYIIGIYSSTGTIFSIIIYIIYFNNDDHDERSEVLNHKTLKIIDVQTILNKMNNRTQIIELHLQETKDTKPGLFCLLNH